MGDAGYGIDPEVLAVARHGRSSRSSTAGVEIAIVVGGGNIFRGLAAASAREWTARRPTTWACSPRS